jgi:cell division GTPase FtsZ
MIEAGLGRRRVHRVNTDAQALALSTPPSGCASASRSPAPGDGRRSLSGKPPKKPRRVESVLEDADMVFVTTAWRRTGTGAAPSCELAREMAAECADVTKPFTLEGSRRSACRRGRQKLAERVDTLISIKNDRLCNWWNAKPHCNSVFGGRRHPTPVAIRASANYHRARLINMDFADVRAIMANAAPREAGARPLCEDRAWPLRSRPSPPQHDITISGAKACCQVKGGEEFDPVRVNQPPS